MTKNSPRFVMLLNTAKANETLQLSESKAYAHIEVISVLLRHAQRHSANFGIGCHYLNFMKNLEQSKLFICFFEKRNEHLSTDTATLQKLKIYL